MSQAILYFVYGQSLRKDHLDNDYNKYADALREHDLIEKRYCGNDEEPRWIGIQTESISEGDDFPIDGDFMKQNVTLELQTQYRKKLVTAVAYLTDAAEDIAGEFGGTVEDVQEFIDYLNDTKPSFFVTWGSS
jgi:hypothetical protein